MVRVLMRSTLLGFSLAIAGAALPGCDQKEDVMEIETPEGEMEVERSTETGAVDVDVDE